MINSINSLRFLQKLSPQPRKKDVKIPFFTPFLRLRSLLSTLRSGTLPKARQKGITVQYSMGDCLAEYGFQFYEGLHQPIFLVSKFGKILKINEAGRKLLQLSHLTKSEIEKVLLVLTGNMQAVSIQRMSIRSTKSTWQLIASNKSDFLLVEIVRH